MLTMNSPYFKPKSDFGRPRITVLTESPRFRESTERP